MDEHISYLKKSCRLCGNRLKDKKRAPPPKAELWLRFRINVDTDREDIHPPCLCLACQRLLYRARNATEPEKIEVSKKLHSWRSHAENCDCQSKQGKGRPSKKTCEQRKGEEAEAAAEKNGSDTESGEESEEEQEKMSCMEFSALM